MLGCCHHRERIKDSAAGVLIDMGAEISEKVK
jgi:hypothetical protein